MSRGFGGIQYGSAVFHGTSITLAVRTGVTLAQAIPNLVGIAKSYVARNSGISGNTSTQMLARFESDCLAYGPSMISLEGGTNDPGASIAVGSVGSAGTYTDNMAKMIVKAKQIGARVTIWVPPLALDGPTDTAIAPYRTAARALASTYSCDLFDNYADEAALPGATQTSYKVSGETPNGIHYSAAGCAWAAGLVGSGAYANSFLAATQPVR